MGAEMMMHALNAEIHIAKGNKMNSIFRPYHAFAMLALATSLLVPGSANAQVKDNIEFGPGSTQDNQRVYINLALHTGSGVEWLSSGDMGVTPWYVNYWGFSINLMAASDAKPLCYELTTSIQNTGYPNFRLWLLDATGYRSVSSTQSAYARVWVDRTHATNDAGILGFASSDAYNNRDFLMMTKLMAPEGALTAATCQVAGKPFVDFTRVNSDGSLYTANTN
jgi:hypothetical protein